MANMRTIVVAAGLLLVVTACGDSGEATTAPTAGDTTTSTVIVTSPDTTAPPTTIVVVSIPPPTAPPADGPSLFPPDPLPGSDGANGSGCNPGEGPLPDGVWVGLVGDHDADGFEFDLACFYFGDIAEEKAAEEGGEAPGGFYISNQNPALRRIDLDRATPVQWLVAPPNADLHFETLPYADWHDDPTGYSNCPGDFCLVWLYVEEGQVTEIVEQYVP